MANRKNITIEDIDPASYSSMEFNDFDKEWRDFQVRRLRIESEKKTVKEDKL